MRGRMADQVFGCGSDGDTHRIRAEDTAKPAANAYGARAKNKVPNLIEEIISNEKQGNLKLAQTASKLTLSRVQSALGLA